MLRLPIQSHKEPSIESELCSTALAMDVILLQLCRVWVSFTLGGAPNACPLPRHAILT